jgi:hypothetical protein
VRACEIHGNSGQAQNKRDTNTRDRTCDRVHIRYWGILPRQIQRLVDNIPDIEVPSGLDIADEKDIIVTTYGSLVFGVGYHSWIVGTDNEQVLLMGGGPDDGDQLLMPSYRYGLGGIASGLAVIGTLIRSVKIKVKSVKLVCENEAAIKACKRKRTQSVFHRTEGDHDLISTIHYLQ